MPTLTTLFSFTYDTSGSGPLIGLFADQDGDLFGTTSIGGQNGYGTVFEVTDTGGVYSPNVLTSFNLTDGGYPHGILAFDAAGDLFGTTVSGGQNGAGTVYEFAKTNGGYSGPTTVFNFSSGEGTPYGGVFIDKDGNLVGTTDRGGANSDGEVYEITTTGGVVTRNVLFTFNGSNGMYPQAGLTADPSGNLFGTTTEGGADGQGVVFEVPYSNGVYGTLKDVASFPGGSGGGNPLLSSLVADSAGDLFGTTQNDGAFGHGTVFEIVKTGPDSYNNQPKILYSFNGNYGSYPAASLIIDAAGNLFGTAIQDGPTTPDGFVGSGTVFELAKTDGGYSGTPTLLAGFDDADGSAPYGALYADAAGDLFGTTKEGGSSNNGTVFEITNSGYVTPAPCYCPGTLILTATGAVAVENLAVGDAVITLAGAHRPIKWIGHRTLDLTKHPDPKAVWPVSVSAGAFGEGLPRRDLRMSPGHNVFVEGVLMPVRVLVNGATVTQMPADAVTYWHVELDSHDVILAEGLPAESYLDTGNRTAFANGGAFVEAHPDFEPKHWAETCAPLVKAGSAVEAAKAALLARAEQIGYATTTRPDLHILADGHRCERIDLGNRRFAFTLPAGCKAVALVSRTFVAAHMKPDSTDGRTLGVAVGRLQVDGCDVDLVTLSEGWHVLERRSGQVRRWTTGATPLPAGTRLVVVDLVGEGRYWIERKDNVVTLRA